LTHYLQEELTSFWSRLTPYLAILESKSPQESLHTTDKKPHGDTSDTPTGQSATYTRFKTADADWGPWQREEY
jgi:hypothetical protein